MKNDCFVTQLYEICRSLKITIERFFRIGKMMISCAQASKCNKRVLKKTRVTISDAISVADCKRSDDWQTFNSYLQNEIAADNSDFVLQDDILRAIVSTNNIFKAFLTSYNSEFFVHPLLYQILNCAVAYSAIYEKQVFKILHFGITHNFNIAKKLCCDSILQNGDIVYDDKIIGRAVVFSTTEALNGTDTLFAKLDELRSSVKAIQTKQLYLAGGYSGLAVRFTDGVIEKERTLNECEYTFLKLLLDNGYLKAPRYLGVKNGKDVFSYIAGKTIAYTYEMSKASIIKITNELKTINTISKKYLKDKVYMCTAIWARRMSFSITLKL